MTKRTMADDLREAIEITRQALAKETIRDAELAVALRAPALERVSQARHAGAPWSEQESTLVGELTELDLQLIQVLWQPTAEAFQWLEGRAPDSVASMPALRSLSEAP